MYYETCEEEIKERLLNLDGSPAGLPANYKVFILPNTQKQFQDSKPQGNDVCITVVYRQSHFDEPESTDHIVQNERLEFEINAMALTRFGSNGIYSAIQYIHQRLLGFKSPTGLFNRLKNKDVAMLDFDEGVWQWIQTMSAETTIGQFIDPESEVNITQITANNYDEDGNIINTIVVPDETLSTD